MTSDAFVALIEHEIAGWEGVSVEPHRFGGVEFRVGRRELGHLHRGGLADLPFPVKVRERLVAEGKAVPASRPSGIGLGEPSHPQSRGRRRPSSSCSG